jgi:hypothetical protein
MQDDIELAARSCQEIIAWVREAPADTGMLTLWNPHPNNHSRYVPVPAETFWSSVFLIFTASKARAYLEWHGTRRAGTGHDMSIKEWAVATKQKIYANSAGLIDHIGQYSTLGSREDRRNPQFRRR